MTASPLSATPTEQRDCTARPVGVRIVADMLDRNAAWCSHPACTAQ